MNGDAKRKWKQVLAGCLFIGAVVTWVSGLLSARQAEKPAPKIDVPADASWDGRELLHAPRSIESPSSAVMPNTGASTPRSDATMRTASTRVDGQDLVAALERSLVVVRASLPARGELDLDVLAKSWSRGVEARMIAEAASRDEHKTPDADPGDRAGRPARDDRATDGERSWQPELTTARSLAIVVQLDSFLAEHPLNDIRIGPRRKLALLGPLLVGEGDELIPGTLKVKSIEPSAVILSTNDGERRIELSTSASLPSHRNPDLVEPWLPTPREDRRNTGIDAKKSRASEEK